jgi:hypothetical protein
MSAETERLLLEQLKQRLNPPTEDELNHSIAQLLFGSNAERMLEHAPWSFLLTKVMWVEGNEPWKA